MGTLGDDMDPPRELKWAPGQTQISWQQATYNGVTVDRFWLFLDTGNCRTVSLWTPAELLAFAENAYMVATGGLTIRDAGDLALLPEVAVDPPG